MEEVVDASRRPEGTDEVTLVRIDSQSDSTQTKLTKTEKYCKRGRLSTRAAAATTTRSRTPMPRTIFDG